MTVACRTGIMIMMMLVVYWLFVCLFVCFLVVLYLYFRLWIYNTVIGTVPVDGWVQRAGDWVMW